jgi:predicted RNase H-like nuclease
VHPELSFCTLAGRPLPVAKDTWNGAALRRRLLHRAGLDLPDDLGEAGRAQVDDLLDAAVVAWTCRRLLQGQAVSWPDPPEPGPGGRPIAIWA